MTAPTRAIGVRFEAQGVPEVQAATRAVQRAASDAATRTRDVSRASIERSAESVRDKWQLAGREISKTFADFGRSGQVAGRELKQMVILGGEMALAFGPAGPIASAVGLLTLGIVSMFKRARDEQAETQKQFMRGLQDMAAAADFAGLQGQAGALWRGRFNTKTGQFEGGARDLLNQERALQPASGFDLGAPGRLKQFYGRTVISPLDGKEITVQQLLDQYRQTITLMQMPLEGPRAPRSPITITAGGSADRKAAAADYERRMLNNGYGYTGPIAPRLLTPADKAMFARLDAASPSPVLSAVLPTEQQIQKDLSETFKQIEYWTTDHLPAIAEKFKPVGHGIADAIGASLQQGLSSAFESLFSGGGLAQSVRQLSQTVLSHLAQLFANIAVKALMLSNLMKGFLKAIGSMNPWLAGAIAASMLIAAQALGGAARGAVSASSAADTASSAASAGAGEQVTRLVWGSDSATLAAGMTPRQTMNVTIIGTNDPSAQRAIQELMKNANRRG